MHLWNVDPTEILFIAQAGFQDVGSISPPCTPHPAKLLVGFISEGMGSRGCPGTVGQGVYGVYVALSTLAQ